MYINRWLISLIGGITIRNVTSKRIKCQHLKLRCSFSIHNIQSRSDTRAATMQQSSSQSPDFFDFLIKDYPVSMISITSLIIQVFVVPSLLHGIIWYERVGSDMKRTLIGMMVSANCWTVTEFM